MELFCKQYGRGTEHLIILHGLLGAGRNWHTACAGLAEKWHILVPDLRNHGRSPHSTAHRLADMVGDTQYLQQQFGASPAVVLGHSMGGLAAMDFAFRAPENLRGIIIVDIAPRPHRADSALILDAMLGVDLANMASKNAVDEALAAAIPDPLVRQFILTNLHKTPNGFRWRANVPALRQFLLESQAYQPAPTQVFAGPVLFIRGGRSGYVRDDDIPIIRHHFPNARIETVAKAGHWVHYNAPEEIVQLVDGFLQEVYS